MKVKLKYPWFSPSVSAKLNKIQSRSGRYYIRGVHVMPDDLFRFLPSTAEVLVAPAVLPDLEEGEGPILETGEPGRLEGHQVEGMTPAMQAVADTIAADNEVAEKAKAGVEDDRLEKQQQQIDRDARKANHKRKAAAAKAKADKAKAAGSRDTK